MAVGVTRHRPVPQDGADPIQHLGHIPTTLWVERAFPEIDVARAAHEKNVTRSGLVCGPAAPALPAISCAISPHLPTPRPLHFTRCRLQCMLCCVVRVWNTTRTCGQKLQRETRNRTGSPRNRSKESPACFSFEVGSERLPKGRTVTEPMRPDLARSALFGSASTHDRVCLPPLQLARSAHGLGLGLGLPVGAHSESSGTGTVTPWHLPRAASCCPVAQARSR